MKRIISFVVYVNVQVESFVHVYEGAAHGWICRYDPNDAKQVADAELAQNKILEWFGKFLH